MKYLYENETQKYTYTCTLDEIYAKRNWLTIGGFLDCGYFVALSSDQFLIDPVNIRITAVKEYLNKPKQPEITLSNEVTGTTLSTTLNKIPTQEQATDRKDDETVRFARRQFADVKQTTEMLQSSLLNFSSSISPLTVETMQLIAGDETLQFEFVNDSDSTVGIPHSEQYDKVAKQFSSEAGVLQHKTLGITNISSSHTASEYKCWNMASYISPVLTDSAKSYYLYARVSKTDNTGVFLLSETAIALEGVGGYYHLLVGILNSEIDGDRSYSQMYGFTEVLPGRITTNKIVSSNGQTYFDLLNNKIKGYIEFMDGLIAGMIKLSSNGVVTAGLQGDSAVNVGAWFGGTDEEALTNIAKIILNKDGSFQFGGGSFRGDAAGNIITDMGFEATEGHVGGFSIFENAIMNDTVEFADEEVETLNELFNPVTNKISKSATWSASSKPNAMAYTQGLTLDKSGSIAFAVSASAGDTASHGAMTLRILISNSTNDVVFSRYITAPDNGVIARTVYSVMLPSGTYNIQAIGTQYSGVFITVNIDSDIVDGTYISAIPSTNRTKIGNDGLFSFWNISRYLYYQANRGLRQKGPSAFLNSSCDAVISDTNTEPIISNINQYSSFILSQNVNDSSNRAIHLPSPSDMEDDVSDFVMRIIVKYTNGGQIWIDSKTGAALYDWNGDVKTRIKMAIGDSVELHAIAESNGFKYFITRVTGAEID